MHSTVSTPTSSPLPSQLVHIPSATSSTPRLPSSLTSTYEHQSISTCWCPSSSPASSPSSSSRWPMGVSSCTCGDDELIGENKSIVIRVSLHLVDQDDDFHSYRFIANNNNNTNTNNNTDAPIQETSNSHFSIHPLSIDTETNTLQLLLSLTSTSSSTSTTCMYSYFALADDEHSKYILFKGEYIHNSRYTNEENFKMTIVDRSNMKAKVFTLIEECDYTDTDSICSIYGNKNCVHVSIDSDHGDDDDDEEEEEDYYYDYYQVSPVYVPSSSQRSLGDNMSLITSLYDSKEYEYEDASVMMAMMTTMIISWRISTTWCILNILIHIMSSASSSSSSSSTPNNKENTE